MRLLDTLNKKRNVPGLEAFADDVDDEPNPKERTNILSKIWKIRIFEKMKFKSLCEDKLDGAGQ